MSRFFRLFLLYHCFIFGNMDKGEVYDNSLQFVFFSGQG